MPERNKYVAKRGVSFLFKEQNQFIDPSTALQEQQQTALLTKIDRHNEMFNCSEDLQQIVTLSFDDWVISKLAALLDANFYPLEIESNFLLWWNLVVYFTVMIIFVENMFTIVILTISYDNQVNPIFQDWQKTIIFIMLLIDIMFVRIRINMEVRGRRLRTHKEIIQYYFTHYFLADIAAIVIMMIDVFTDNHQTLLKTIYYVKIYSMLQINSQLSYKLRYYPKSIALYRFIKYSFFLVYWSFFISAVYVMASVYVIHLNGFQYQNGLVWLTSSPGLKFTNVYEDFPWYVWQEYAIFLFMQTARGCGYGVVSPRNPLQMFVVSYGTLLIIIGFGYYTNGIMNIIAKLDLQVDKIADETSVINTFDSSQPFSYQIYQKYRSHIVYSSYRRRRDVINIMREHLPDDKFREFNYATQQYYILRFGLLQHINVDDNHEFRIDMGQIIKLKGAYQKQYLFKMNQIGPEILYLSQHQQIVTKRTELNYYLINQSWAFIGVREFYIDSKAMFDIFTQNSVTLEYIQKSQFIGVLKKYRKIYEKYWEEIYRIKIQRQSTSKIELNCWACSGDHIYENCPFFFDWRTSVKLKVRKVSSVGQQGHKRVKKQRVQLTQKKVIGFHYSTFNFEEIYRGCSVFPAFNM